MTQAPIAVETFAGRRAGADMAVRVLCFVVDIALALHFAAGALWWWFSPKGFASDSNQFWTNSVLPLAAMALAGTGIVALHFGHRRLAAGSILMFACAWAAAAIAARVVFPMSLASIWLAFAGIAGTGAGIFALLIRRQPRCSMMWAACVLSGMVIGLLVVRWQIPASPSTIPWNPSIPVLFAKENRASVSPQISIDANGTFQPDSGQLFVFHGDLRLRCSPLLEFDRISPDHFWSLFARRRWTPVRQVVAASSIDGESAVEYSDGATVRIRQAKRGEPVRVAAYTPVREATYSHLNTFCYLEIGRLATPAISFSPCPDAVVDVLRADYPVGRPARFAYLDADNRFHVCEATSGEKGPFRELASGILSRGEPLKITFHDQGRPIASITLDDWSAQLSTAISPSAGWRVPMNSIEFQRLDDAPTADVGVWVTLAATAVGRGFETVGHSAGTYRSRIEVELLPMSH